MTSQRWLTEKEVERPLWTHWLTVIRPKTVTSDIAFLYITGGSLDRDPPAEPPAWLVDAARDTGTVTAELRLVPNQPVVFTDDPTHAGRSEDDFIAYTWNKFLRTGDERWPARLPMTKSAVRAMDAVTAFTTSSAGGGHAATRFVVSGASKRGWTTWATAAVDPRVIAIAPAVIDLLNIEPSFKHHFQAYGAWSDAVQDYVDQGIMKWLGTPQFKALMRIEEPYEYRERLTMPKFIINASGDQFFLPDSSQFYFDQLPGEKHLRYVPNASHSLDKTDALESVEAFYASIVHGTPRPDINWTFERDGSIKAVAKDRPGEVVMWQASNPDARNFRQDVIGNAYQSTRADAVRPEHLGCAGAGAEEGMDGVLRRNDVSRPAAVSAESDHWNPRAPGHAAVRGAQAQSAAAASAPPPPRKAVRSRRLRRHCRRSDDRGFRCA